ncbi:DNA polymerase III subunit delta [Buchnera aphidicola (Cinara piceae)]|uniref:DNA polymerase III subunit delta, partial n=1 Tax=Buchnera aphidicola (Cinara piceae) TaxID=1660043 RepID=A0A803FU48_9GAMM|nr:hypothetical protein [Buchnera aphidicola]VFP88565.1 DNA polymerase III subunit delta [Buchnera aphidicola (Cinara piceae)]
MFIDTINLKNYIKKKKIFTYIILESEYIFIQANKNIILNHIKKKKYIFKQELIIHHNNDWNNIFEIFKKKDLFNKKKIFSITIYDYFMSLNLQKKMKKIETYSLDKTIKIFYFPNLYYNFLCKKFFYSYLKNTGVIINNSSSYINNIKYWIHSTIKNCNCTMTSEAKNFFLKKIYINIKYFTNLLENIILLYPNTLITKKMIYKYYKKNKILNYHDWIQSIIYKKKEKSIKILKLLKKQKYNYVILINAYKKLIYMILYNKKKEYIENKFINYKININTFLLNCLIKNNSINIIKLILKLLKKIEICIQKNQKKNIWMHLKTLSIIFN